MSEEKESTPEWLKNSLGSINRIKDNIEPVRQEGREEIVRGLQKLQIANKLKQEIGYVEQTLSQNFIPVELWNDNVVTASGVHLSNTLHRYAESTNILPGLAAGGAAFGEQQHEYIVRALNTTCMTSGTATYLSAGIERRFETIRPEYRPILLVSPPERLGTRDHLLNELRENLSNYESKFVNMLNGSEQALGQDNPDHLSQAAHSMRDLFQQLIEYLAPTNVVKEQPWFESIRGAPGGVSRRYRLRYMLYGSGVGFDEHILQQLDETANEAKEALDIAIARAHDHDPSLSLNEVQLVIDLARFSLNEVLKIYSVHR